MSAANSSTKKREVVSLFDNLITADEIEKISRGNVTRNTLRNWIYKRELPQTIYVKIKNKLWFNQKEFEAWLLKRSS